MTHTKTVSTRINENVHTLFTEYCNQKGMTISNMLSHFVNDIVSQNKDYINSSQYNKNDESAKPQNFSQDEPLKEELKPRKTLDQKIRIVDSKNRKIDEEKKLLDSIPRGDLEKLLGKIKVRKEPEFDQSKDELGEFMKSLMNNSRKNNHNYNQDLVKLAFAPYLKDLKQSISDLNTKFDTKIDEDRMKYELHNKSDEDL